MRDASDIEQAMHSYGDAVWRACLLYLAPSDAEDVFQDAYIKYALHDAPFRSERHKKAWLLRVAINACKDALKAARNKNASLEGLVERGGEGALPTAGDSPEGLIDIRNALDALGDPPKTQLYLALYEGYTARDISRMTGMPTGTVYSWISRGKQQLREALS